MRHFHFAKQSFPVLKIVSCIGATFVFIWTLGYSVSRCDATQSEDSDIKGRWIERDDQSFALASTDESIPGVALQLIEPASQIYEGIVLGIVGKPAVGAEVWFGGFYGRIPLRERTKTNDEGKYSIPLPDLDDIGNVTWSVVAILNNDSSQVVFRPAMKGVKLELVRGRKLTLRAKEANDKPIKSFTAHLEDGRLVSSDGDGKCMILGLAPRVQYIGLTAPGFVSQFWRMDFFDERDVEYTHPTEPAGVVSGIVHDEEKRPVPWNEVTGRTSERSIFTVGHVFTNAKGKYRLSGLSLTRKNRIAAFSHQFENMTYQNDSEVVFKDNTTAATCDFEVTPNHLQPPDPNVIYSVAAGKEPERGFFRGKVTLPDGKPCTNFRLRFSSSRVAPQLTGSYAASYESLGVIYSSPDGSFVFSDVGLGTAFRIAVSADGFQDQIADPAIGVSSERLVDSDSIAIQLKAAQSVRVVVRDTKGGSVNAATVALYRADPNSVLAPYYKDFHVVKGSTNLNGVLVLPAVTLKEGRWIVEGAGYPEQQFAWNGEVESSLSLIQAVSVTINFKVVGETEHELAFMLVGSDGRNVHRKDNIPVENAKWAISDLLPERYTLQVYHPGQGGALFYFKDGVGSQLLDLQDQAGKSKEFLFELKPK